MAAASRYILSEFQQHYLLVGTLLIGRSHSWRPAGYDRALHFRLDHISACPLGGAAYWQCVFWGGVSLFQTKPCAPCVHEEILVLTQLSIARFSCIRAFFHSWSMHIPRMLQAHSQRTALRVHLPAGYSLSLAYKVSVFHIDTFAVGYWALAPRETNDDRELLATWLFIGWKLQE